MQKWLEEQNEKHVQLQAVPDVPIPGGEVQIERDELVDQADEPRPYCSDFEPMVDQEGNPIPEYQNLDDLQGVDQMLRRRMKRKTDRRQAWWHQCIHKYMDPLCESCQLTRGERKHVFRGAQLGTKPERFGQQWTGDHMVLRGKRNLGVRGTTTYEDAFLVID